MWALPSALTSAYAAASGCLTSDLNSPPAAGLWLTLSGTATQRPLSWHGWKTRPWSQRLFGAVISEPSRLRSFTTWWTASLRDSRASQPAWQGAARASMTNAGYGPSSPMYFASLDAGGRSWRTSQDCLPFEVDSTPSSPTWPRSGSMRNGVAFERPMWVPAISESGFSFWPTADANTSTYSNGMRGENLREKTARWTSPTSSDAYTDKLTSSQQVEGSKHSVNLSQEVANWPTPASSDACRAGTQTENMTGQSLTQTVNSLTEHWATPNAHDGRRPGVDERSTQGGNLNRDAALWPTPAAGDGTKGPSTYAGGNPSLGTAASSHQVRVISMDGEGLSPTEVSSSGRQRLNPAFVCWLMGWPWWWTRPEPISFAAGEMASYRFRLQSLLDTYAPDLETEAAA